MHPIPNAKKELLAHNYVRTLDWYEALRLTGLLPELPEEPTEEQMKAYNRRLDNKVHYYKSDREMITRIAELQEADSKIQITKQQLVAARMALAHAAMQGDDRYGYNASKGQFEPTGEKIRDYKAADGALAGVAKMLGMDAPAEDRGGVVVVLPPALMDAASQPAFPDVRELPEEG